MRLLVTRPAGEAEDTARALRAKGHEVLVSPVLEVVATGAPLPAGPFAACLATSAQALDVLTPEQVRGLRGLPLHVVGSRTAKAARARGLGDPATVAADGAKLAESLREAGLAARDVLYLAGRHRKPTLEEACARLGCRLRVLEIYEARAAAALTPEARAALAQSGVDAVLHFSRRSATLALDLSRTAGVIAGFAHARHLCLSEDVASPLRAFGLSAEIARAPDTRSLFEALETG